MKPLGRAAGSTVGPELDDRLHDIFDDRRTPGASEALYRYLGDLAMDSPAAPERGRFGFSWSSMSRVGRMAAALAVVAVIGAGVFAVTVGVPRDSGVGSSSSAAPGAIPSTPIAPAGWRWVSSFGDGGPDGLWTSTNILAPAPRIAVHVVCNGPDDMVVLASTEAGMSWLDGRPAQAATFRCAVGGQDSRVEFTAQSGDFQEVAAIVARNPASIVDTSFVVSIEVPDGTSPPPSR
jgi:hypothetical protein